MTFHNNLLRFYHEFEADIGSGTFDLETHQYWIVGANHPVKQWFGGEHGDHNIMKRHMIATEMHSGLRAGGISSLVLALCYLAMTGLSDLPRVLAFIGLFAVCFVLMMKSVVELLVWAFGLAARCSGLGLGHSVRLLRRVF